MGIRPREIDFATFTIADVPAGPEPFRLANRIPIRENGEKLVDLRETNPELSFADYCLPYVRESVAEALREATRRLPDPLDLRMYTALRTIEQQGEMYWGAYKRAQENHPTWPSATVRRMTNRFFAPPDSKAPPGHCTGGAVDVGLHVRDSGEGLDVRSPLEGWKGAPTAAQGLNADSAENRRLLCYLMHSTGLSNCRDEFWHWSYGDCPWAVRLGEPIACYGLIAPPEDATRVRGGKLVLLPYDPTWPDRFNQIRAALVETIDPVTGRIEHVGSTAVPGLSGEPVLDVVIAVETSDQMTRLIELLESIGYEQRGDLAREGREAFTLRQGEEWKDAPSRSWHPHQIYACLDESNQLQRHLAFRDHLRRNSAAATEYAMLKRELSERYPWDRTRYSGLKGSFISSVLQEIGSSPLAPRP
jgi:D-alanyl-D-alanine dipeptidase